MSMDRPDITKYTKNSYAVYPFGSRVYGTARPGSDWDFVVVTGKDRTGEMENGLINIKYLTPDHFQHLLDEHHIMALECHFLPRGLWYDQYIVEPDKPWKFKLDLSKLRHSLSEKSSHSWVKAKKKFVSPYDRKNELERGKKSLWHSIRIIDFGIQIATLRTIFGYNELNHIFREIMDNPSENWQDYEEKWKPVRNAMLTRFREVAPK